VISIVEEGTVITEEDVRNGKVLVELDSSAIAERLEQQEITHASAKAAFDSAREALDIQRSDSESKIKDGMLNVKFSHMDLQQYVGEDLAKAALAKEADLLKIADILYREAREQRAFIEAELAKAMAEVEQALKEPAREDVDPNKPSEETSASGPRLPSMDDRLGGTALQKKRTLDSDIALTIEEFKRAADKLMWTARLEKKGFVSSNDLEADQLALKRQQIAMDQALTDRELFLRYEFPKEAEKLLSLYEERGKELERIKARARSAISQAEVELKSAEAKFIVQDRRLKNLKEQRDYCTIRATTPGLVIYGTVGGSWRSRGSPIEVGSTVHERQELIRMPDISSLAVGIDVHESLIDKVEKGMPARVKVDVFPDMKLTGKVHKIAVLAKSEWFNPDLKEYETTISIDGVHDSLKPGMSAEVEIHVATLKNVLQVPIQAVTARSGKTVVYVLDSKGNEEAREVVTGEANDRFVEIRDGLREGEVILLEAPQLLGPEEEKQEKEKEKTDRNGPPEPPAVRGTTKGGQGPPKGKGTSGRSRPEGKSPRKGRPPRKPKTE
jgi:RND family efflux transporter MFP subunit